MYQSAHLKWLENPEILANYRYEWVAIHAEKGVIAHGTYLSKVTEEGEALSSDTLLFHYVTPEDLIL
ncbi:MAG: hypothetical protein WCO84_07985 [bacterium]